MSIKLLELIIAWWPFFNITINLAQFEKNRTFESNCAHGYISAIKTFPQSNYWWPLVIKKSGSHSANISLQQLIFRVLFLYDYQVYLIALKHSLKKAFAAKFQIAKKLKQAFVRYCFLSKIENAEEFPSKTNCSENRSMPYLQRFKQRSPS